MIDVRNLIKQFSQSQQHLIEGLAEMKSVSENEDQLWSLLEKKEQVFFCNDKSFDFLADALQLVNSRERFGTYELNDIETMYRLLVEYYPDNLQYKIDLISFLYSVMDNETEASNMRTEMQIELDKYAKQLGNIFKG